MLWQDARVPLHRQKTELNLDSDIQVPRIAYEDRNASRHKTMIVQHPKISLTSSRLITQVPYHLSRPHALRPTTHHTTTCIPRYFITRPESYQDFRQPYTSMVYHGPSDMAASPVVAVRMVHG